MRIRTVTSNTKCTLSRQLPSKRVSTASVRRSETSASIPFLTSSTNAVDVSGAAVTASRLGLPDLGFVGIDDFVEIASMMAEIPDCPPLICDADTGFGGAAQIARMVQRYVSELQEDDGDCEYLSTCVASCRYCRLPHRRPNSDEAMRTPSRQTTGVRGRIRITNTRSKVWT